MDLQQQQQSVHTLGNARPCMDTRGDTRQREGEVVSHPPAKHSV
jgi:hypothetical protein